MKKLDQYFDFTEVNKAEVIDMASALTVFLKSLAQVVTPIVSATIYGWYGFPMVVYTFVALSFFYAFILSVIL
jgi:nitrate reductase NapE component